MDEEKLVSTLLTEVTYALEERGSVLISNNFYINNVIGDNVVVTFDDDTQTYRFYVISAEECKLEKIK